MRDFWNRAAECIFLAKRFVPWQLGKIAATRNGPNERTKAAWLMLRRSA
jgi:hypothetical protein